MFAEGMLAIWSDVAPQAETDYVHWLTREHAAERLGTAGFLSVRVFRAMDFDIRRYFIVYELENPSALSSEDYVRKLNNPTQWSQRIMPTLKNFGRGGGVIVRESAGEGGFAAPVPFAREALPQYLEAAAGIASADRMAGARIFETDRAASEIATSEKSMRAGDASFEAMLLVEALDERMLASGLAVMQVPERAVYRQVFALCRDGA
jgi:hypothetical protein